MANLKRLFNDEMEINYRKSLTRVSLTLNIVKLPIKILFEIKKEKLNEFKF